MFCSSSGIAYSVFMSTNKPIKITNAATFISNNVADNTVSIIASIKAASIAGARLIQFPEGALSGYVKSQIKTWDDYDWSLLARKLKEICAAAKAYKVWVVVGSAQRQEGKRPTNCLHIINGNGEHITRYDKRFCSHSEITDWYSAGNEPVTFEIDGYKFGCALCIEVQFPEVFIDYEARDVDCVLFSSYSDNEMFVTQAQGHAACNNYWISYCSPEQCQNDCSNALIGPDGSIQTRATSPSELIISHLNRDDPKYDIPLNKARPWRRLARTRSIYKS